MREIMFEMLELDRKWWRQNVPVLMNETCKI